MASILLVDDDPDVLDVLREILEQAGHRVMAAGSGSMALDILDRGEPADLLITDVVMPGLHGFNLARMARHRRHGLKILYLSGFADAAAITRDDGPLFGKLLNKPMPFREFMAEVEEALGATRCPAATSPKREGCDAGGSRSISPASASVSIDPNLKIA